MLGAVIIVAFLVRSTLQSADKARPIHSVYLKIMANHFQIIGIIANINFSWPSEIQVIYTSQSKVSGVT